jgi:hypothetical protein
MANKGKVLGIIALLIAIGAMGFSVYQFILPSASAGTTVYATTNENTIYLDSNTFESIPNLNITYNTKAGQSVLLEFSCQISIEIDGVSTEVDFKFEIDGLPPTPDTMVSVHGLGPDIYLHTSFIMRHNIQSSAEGSHIVKTITKIDDTTTTTFVKYCVLTATVY